MGTPNNVVENDVADVLNWTYDLTQRRILINGADAATPVVGSTLNLVSTDAAVGGGTFFDGYLHGAIAEIIVYDAYKSVAGDREKIQSYLALKYGITLDQTSATDYIASDGTTKMWDGTGNATYNNDIAGIGRDDGSALLQKQSMSVNSDALVAMGLGTIAADNASNPNSFAVDLNFMTWGNNDGSTSTSTPLTGTSLNHMGRIWRIDETGTVGTVQARILQSALNGTMPQLVVSSDATFDNSDTQTALTSDGSGNYVATVDFNDGDYFTFAQLPPPTLAPGGVDVGISG